MTTTAIDQDAGGARRYAGAAIALHWIIAAAILTQLGMAWYMGALPEDSDAQDWVEGMVHVPLGLTILVLSLARVAVRLANPPPPMPAGLAGWEKALAAVSHAGFYLLILALPLTGWALKSFFPRPISFLGLFNWPQLPLIGDIPRSQAREVYGSLETFHGTVMAWVLVALLVLHVAGAVKHQFDGKPVLWRMLPFLKKPLA